jgi:O-antigen/teichoic acid export membrane protein
LSGLEDHDVTPRPSISTLGAHTFAARVGVYALGAVASILIARALGPEGRGRYYLPVTIVTVAYYVANLGVQQAQFRLWSKRAAPPQTFVTSEAFLAAVLGGVATALTWLVVLAWDPSDIDTADVAIVLPAIPLLVHSLFVTSFLTLAGELPLTNIARLLGAAAQTGGAVILFAFDKLTVEAVLLLYLISIVAPWLILIGRLRRIARPTFPVPWRFAVGQLRLGIQIWPYILFSYLNMRLDVFFVAAYLDIAHVGLYSVAVIFGELLWLGTDSVTSAIAERQGNAPEEEALDVTLRAVRMNVVLALVLGVLIAVASWPLIRLLFGIRFIPAAKVVVILVPAAMAMAVWRPLAAALLRFASPWVQPSVAVTALAVNVVANIVLIPARGIVGAGLASLLSYACGAILAAIIFVRTTEADLTQLVPRKAELRQLIALIRRPSLAQLARMSRG